jgi:hypothetical protein
VGKQTNKMNRKRVGLRKNKVKERVAAVEQSQMTGIDMLIGEVRRIDGNVRVVAEGIENVDNAAAALAMLLIAKGVITKEEFQAKEAKIVQLRAEVSAKAKAEQEAVATQVKADAEEAKELAPDTELVQLHNRAVKAGETNEHPEGAFFFGG